MSQQRDRKPGIENDLLNDGVAVSIARMMSSLLTVLIEWQPKYK